MLPAMVASLVGGIPASLVAVPADVVKKEMMLSSGAHASSALHTYRHLVSTRGSKGLLTGWKVNLIKDIPFAAIKVTLFDVLSSAYKKYGLAHADAPADVELSPLESAAVGSLTGVVTGVLTCPMDVVNTRIKSGEFFGPVISPATWAMRAYGPSLC